MATYHNAIMLAGRVLEGAHKIMFCWAIRAALLTLGIGCAFPQPYAHSFSC